MQCQQVVVRTASATRAVAPRLRTTSSPASAPRSRSISPPLPADALRARVSSRIADPIVRQFWTVEFPGYRPQLQAEALSPVLNKLGAFVGNGFARRIVAQARSRLDIGALMNRGGILVADLSVGRIGEDASRLLGSLLLSSVQLAAMRRTGGEPPFFLYVDEFQHFVTESLSVRCASARKERCLPADALNALRLPPNMVLSTIWPTFSMVARPPSR